MGSKITPGQPFPRLQDKNIHGAEVSIPGSVTWTHLQFRHFAGYPICNLHLQSFVADMTRLLMPESGRSSSFAHLTLNSCLTRGASPSTSLATPEGRYIGNTASEAPSPPFWPRKPGRVAEGESQEGQARAEGHANRRDPGTAHELSHRFGRIGQSGSLRNPCPRPVDS
jgi:hypothetical protein